ncbi:MAG: hypothetical protein KBT04_06285 [Bacteroidales bacterium]|nr:hypothetical protein [Candidatus Colimorpha onthohippi]
MRRLIIAMMALLLTLSVSAQVDRNAYIQQRKQMQQRFQQQQGQMRQQYADSRRKAQQEYAEFRRKANEEYAASLSQGWKQTSTLPPVLPPKAEPKPARQPMAPIQKIPSAISLPYGEVVNLPAPPHSVPIPDIPEPEPSTPMLRFSLYGQICEVHADSDVLKFQLPSVDERGAASMWRVLSQEKYNGILHDCLAQREALHLGDWGYLRLLQAMSEQLLGKGSDEAVLMQMYLLTQSGYAVRLAKQNGHFALLMPFTHTLYGYSFVTIDGQEYYLLSKNAKGTVLVCEVGFPKEKVANFQMAELPKFSGKQIQERTFVAKHYGDMKATVRVNKALIEFLDDYPESNALDCYALVGLSNEAKEDLYPVLRTQIKGKSKADAVAMLLNFVQTAFDYATDQEQFGYERPLFGDESLFYPSNDCEDRSILYSILVRDLLGLDVALVRWPGHVATAVCLTEEVAGDYFTIDGRRFTVCDPTYIGADIGQTMPNFKNASARLIKL